MRLKHVDLVAGCVYQDAREVKTKFRKTFTTYFFRVGDEINDIVVDCAGVPYFKPQSLRDTLTHFAQSVCKTPEQFKAFSQNLGHEGVLTTFVSYGQVTSRRQGEIIHNLGSAPRADQPDAEQIVEAVLRRMGRSGS
jgi:hypothetical protein